MTHFTFNEINDVIQKDGASENQGIIYKLIKTTDPKWSTKSTI